VSVEIHHALMSQSGDMKAVKRICAHSQALSQCASYLDRNYPSIERVAVSSNAEGARLAAQDASTAAIAHAGAAHIYALSVVAKAIQDDPSNRTRSKWRGSNIAYFVGA
jgi:chorismate mutase / prephenate dehydratase